MCWSALRKEDKQLKVAREPITVYKFLRRVSEDGDLSVYVFIRIPFFGMIRRLVYKRLKKGTLVASSFPTVYEVGKRYKGTLQKPDGFGDVEKGFHFKKRLVDAVSENMPVVECEIPIGAKYYENRYEIVANEFIIKREIPDKEITEIHESCWKQW